jgi:hypothetical protein
MSGTVIITIVAVAVILVVFGIPLYAVRRRTRIQIEDGAAGTVTASLEVTPVNDSEPRLNQVPAVTSAAVAVDQNATVMHASPVPPAKPARKRTAKKAAVAPITKKKVTRARKPKTDIAEKQLIKDLNAAIDKVQPVLVKEIAKKQVSKKGEPKKTRTTKPAGAVKKPATKSKKSK